MCFLYFSGKLGWKSHTLTYEETTAEVIEVLGTQSSPAYRAFLRKLGISYLIAGDENGLNYELLLTKLKTLFDIDMLMLGGGGVLNWSFIQAGYCDGSKVWLNAESTLKYPERFEATNRAVDG